MDVFYVGSSGRADPTRASLPLHLAVNGSAAVGQATGVVLAGDATELVVGATVDEVEGVGLPPLRELAAMAREQEVPVFV